jgi:hypothetical protein
MSQPNPTTFKYSAPIWALQAAYDAGVSIPDVTEAKITAKQAVLTVAGQDKPVKVFRRNAFSK